MIAEQTVDIYLAELRAQLGGMTLNEREEIVSEIAAHIRDSIEQTGASAATILARLGPAEELAKQYRDGLLIRQASRSVSPIALLRGALRLATTGVFGVLVFFVGAFGYLGGGMVLSGLLKPIFPANTGVWFREQHIVSSGTLFPAPHAPAHEILGMWYVPAALVLGSLTLLFTTFAIRTSLRISHQWKAKLS
jgi:uncharacterized membrane protein